MTPKEYETAIHRLAVIATDIAMRTPIKWTSAQYLTSIRTHTVDEIRKVLDAMGVDWRKAHKTLRDERKALKRMAK
jgi:hypothetical protein